MDTSRENILSNLLLRLVALGHEIGAEFTQATQQGIPGMRNRDQHHHIAGFFDEYLFAFEAKLLWQSDGLALTILKQFCGFHDVFNRLNIYLKYIRFQTCVNRIFVIPLKAIITPIVIPA